MILIIISIVLSAALFVVLGKVIVKDDYGRDRETWKINKNQVLAAAPFLLILLNFFTIIPANHVGILYSPFKGIRQETISEGLKSKGLLDRVYKINTEVQTKTLESITGQTADSQYIEMEIDVKYKVDETTAFQVFKRYRNLENIATNLIPPTVQRSIESVSTQFNVMDILGDKRNDLYIGIEKELATRLQSEGITFISINFTDTDAGTEIEKAIQAEAIAKKAVETAEQERLKTEVEVQKRVVAAKAAKEEAAIEAETKLIKAQAEADANKILSESITPELIKKMEMEARQKFGWVTVQGSSVITDTRTE